MLRATEHGHFTTNKLWQFHSFSGEPAIVENTYELSENIGWEEIITTIEWYKARYTNGVVDRVERDSGEVFTYINWELDGDSYNQ